MPNVGPKSELRKLERFVREIELRYLEPHATNASLGAPSRDEQLDVAAFVVLAHGAIENFVEGLALWVVERVEENWINKRRVSRSMATLLLRVKWQAGDGAEMHAVFDVLREALAVAKSERSNAANSNNGITPKHLRGLFVPLGVDVPSDSVLVASPESLVAMRHEWAHQYRLGAKNPKGALDMKKTCRDCLDFAKELSSRVLALHL